MKPQPTADARPNRTIPPTRREFLQQTAALAAGFGLGAFAAAPAVRADAADSPTGDGTRKFKICFSPGMIGVRANLRESIDLAKQFGFEAVEPATGELAALSNEAMKALREDMTAKGLVWGAAGMGMPFGRPDAEFKTWLEKLPETAAVLQRAGARRMATWISPGDGQATYMENFRRHARRVGEAARVFEDHGCVLGLEYIGPKTGWSNSRYPFIHTMREMRELIAEAGRPNVGLLLDSWHWYTAGETPADIKTLRNQDIVSVHLNDAPAGIAVDRQIDNRRALPAATGVIDIAGFLGALKTVGYDGPVAAEPFDAELRQAPREQALQRTIDAIRKALAQA